MKLVKQYLYSKWTSIEKINGWKHYEVKNVFVIDKKLEIFSACEKSITEIISIKEIHNEEKWISGWK